MHKLTVQEGFVPHAPVISCSDLTTNRYDLGSSPRSVWLRIYPLPSLPPIRRRRKNTSHTQRGEALQRHLAWLRPRLISASKVIPQNIWQEAFPNSLPLLVCAQNLSQVHAPWGKNEEERQQQALEEQTSNQIYLLKYSSNFTRS